MRRKAIVLIAALLVACFISSPGFATVMMTEFNSSTGVSGQNIEFVEFTNVGGAGVDMTGWSETDSDDDPGTHSLSAFGTLAPGESAILTEADPDAFRTYWWGSVAGAPAGLKIIGPYTNENLSSGGDQINLYDGNPTLIDRLDYPNGGGTGAGVSRNPSSPSVLGTNQNSLWLNSALGDAFGSFQAAQNTNLIGNPGTYTFATVPEPCTLALAAIGVAGIAALRRRRK